MTTPPNVGGSIKVSCPSRPGWVQPLFVARRMAIECNYLSCTSKTISTLYELKPGDHIRVRGELGEFLDTFSNDLKVYTHHMLVVEVLNRHEISVIHKTVRGVEEEKRPYRPDDITVVEYYGVPFVSKRFFSVNLRYSCHDSLSWRRFPFRGDDSLFAVTIVFSWRRFPFRGDDSLFVATIPFSRRRFSFRGDDSLSRRRLSFRGDDSLFAATILFSWRLIDMGCRLFQNDFSPVYRAATCFSRRRTVNAATNKCDDFAATNRHDMRAPTNRFRGPPVTMATISR